MMFHHKNEEEKHMKTNINDVDTSEEENMETKGVKTLLGNLKKTIVKEIL